MPCILNAKYPGLLTSGLRQYAAAYTPSRPYTPSTSAIAIAPFIVSSAPKFHSVIAIGVSGIVLVDDRRILGTNAMGASIDDSST